MSRYIIQKSPPLNGTVRVSGSKNAVLPILTASLLVEDKCKILDVPYLKDVIVMKELLEYLGAEIIWDIHKETIEICVKHIKQYETSYDLAAKMRASFLVAGPLLARVKKAKIPLPGGCAIGSRPIDLHLKGFAALGADILQQNGYVEICADQLTGAEIYLDFPSVGATENIMMAATLAKGQTIIQNAAVEPEIVDLANYLNEMGANIKGAGTDAIKIVGVDTLKGTTHAVIPDRIEAGTFMLAGAITHGNIFLENVMSDHLKPVIAKLKECDVDITETHRGICINASKETKAVDIKTLPYPGFPTDMQAPFMSLLTTSQGTGIITETVFENRFMHVGELKRMGANIKIESRTAIVEGVTGLMGAKVKATDLRAGAALVLCALAAENTTEIEQIYHIERGYSKLDQKLQKLGAKIQRI